MSGHCLFMVNLTLQEIRCGAKKDVAHVPDKPGILLSHCTIMFCICLRVLALLTVYAHHFLVILVF